MSRDGKVEKTEVRPFFMNCLQFIVNAFGNDKLKLFISMVGRVRSVILVTPKHGVLVRGKTQSFSQVLRQTDPKSNH